jgi:hypothetical protein
MDYLRYLYNCSAQEDNSRIIWMGREEYRIFSFLVAAIRQYAFEQRDDDRLEMTLETLLNLSQTPENTVLLCRENGLVPVLVQLSETEPRVQIFSVSLKVLSLMIRHEGNQSYLISQGLVIPMLVNMLVSVCNRRICNACSCLSYMSSKTHDTRNHMLLGDQGLVVMSALTSIIRACSLPCTKGVYLAAVHGMDVCQMP